MKVPISVVIVAKNEEGRIKECLESVYGWAQEIILADDESDDRTRQIAEQYADKIVVRKMDIEGRHRNWAYAQSQCDWVFSLDADERFTPGLKDEIVQVLRQSALAAAYTVPRKNFLGAYWLKWGGQYPSAQLKMFRKDKFKWEEVEVHPRALLDGECGHLTNPLLHYTYRDFSDFMRKLNTQTTLEAEKWHKLCRTNPKKAAYKMNIVHVLWRCFDRFLRAYVGKQGWRDGLRGFMMAVFASWYQLLSYAKYWEMGKIDIKASNKN